MEQYNLIRRRRMKNLRLRVKEDGKVYVSAPYGVSVSVIDDFVASRADWIAEQRKKLSELAPSPTKTELNDGDVITLLGRPYVVTLVEGKEEAFLEGGMLVVPVENMNEAETKVLTLMAGICRSKCTEAVRMYLRKADYSGRAVDLQFKYMKSRWGSYNSRDNTITFNLAVCKLPEKYIDYIAAHEVTHIYVHNHSDDFYRAGEKIFDNFFRTDRELNKIRIGGIFS